MVGSCTGSVGKDFKPGERRISNVGLHDIGKGRRGSRVQPEDVMKHERRGSKVGLDDDTGHGGGPARGRRSSKAGLDEINLQNKRRTSNVGLEGPAAGRRGSNVGLLQHNAPKPDKGRRTSNAGLEDASKNKQQPGDEFHKQQKFVKEFVNQLDCVGKDRVRVGYIRNIAQMFGLSTFQKISDITTAIG